MGYVLYGDRLGVWGSGGREEPSHSDRRTRGFQTGAYKGLQRVQDRCQVKRKLERVQRGDGRDHRGRSEGPSLSVTDSTSIVSSHLLGPTLGAETEMGS